MYRVTNADVVGLVRPAIDAHTLGILSFAQILRECGIRVEIADNAVNTEIDALMKEGAPLDAFFAGYGGQELIYLVFRIALTPTAEWRSLRALSSACGAPSSWQRMADK